ncbi:MAG: hypothetical protein C0436_01560 [Alphaproteobacteria bacterium]|nr:hypothetical protein [Alphaproteobacteria bacterium]
METRERIAIIGGGISGLSAAYVLQQRYDVTLYEKEPRLGGHARTLTVDYEGKEIAVDTGFIVFNDRNYPHLNGLFKTLGVAYHKSNMSFAARIGNGDSVFEYSSKSVQGIFPTLPSLLDGKRWTILRDYFRFSRKTKRFLMSPDNRTLGQWVADTKVSDAFVHYFILPMGAAIWSCPVSQMLDYPAETFARFFNNHGLLDYNGQPQWYTVTGGSREYVAALARHLVAAPRVAQPVIEVRRTSNGVSVKTAAEEAHYDQVLFACHADEALAMHTDATQEERNILSAFRFNVNTAYLHSDDNLMPSDKRCWASWVYLSDAQRDTAPNLAVTYWMNLLQGLDRERPLFVTLNPKQPPDAAKTFNIHAFMHPIFDRAAIDAQKHIDSINGKNRIWWCGAWQRYGFHEDGIASAMNVAKNLGVPIPWQL